MKCDDFNEWLQNQLDERQGVVFSHPVRKHLSKCHVCRDQLNAWKQIASILPVHHEFERIDAAVSDPPYQRWPTWIAIAGAAVLCVVLLTQRWSQPTIHVAYALQTNETLEAQSSDAVTASHSSNHSNDSSNTQANVSLNPSSWWQNVQKRGWISRTLNNTKPTVESMRNGVAPLGRSIVLAVSLLTRMGGDQTS